MLDTFPGHPCKCNIKCVLCVSCTCEYLSCHDLHGSDGSGYLLSRLSKPKGNDVDNNEGEEGGKIVGIFGRQNCRNICTGGGAEFLPSPLGFISVEAGHMH